MRVVAFGTYDAAVHPRTGVLCEGLVAIGVDVVEMNHPLGIPTASRVRMLDEPSQLPVLLLRILRCWAFLVVRRVTTRTRADAVLVGYLGHFDVVLARVLFPRTPVVLDYLVSAADTAADRRAGGRAMSLLAALDRIACACADVILVDTARSVVTVPSSRRDRALVVPVGAPTAWFRPPPDEREPGPLRVVFFGLFTPLQGAPVIAQALRVARDRGLELEATMIGDGQDADAARAAAPDSAVSWVTWVEPEDLIDVVAAHDVCLGILGATPKALRVVPNKAYQGAAAGCLVVTSDTDVQRRGLPAATAFVPPGDADALADLLVGLPRPDALLDRRRSSQLEAADSFSPAACAEPLVARLAELG